MAGTRHEEESEMLKGQLRSSHPFEFPGSACSFLPNCCVSAWLDGDPLC